VNDPWASGRAMVSQAMLADQRNERHLARALGRDALALQLQIGDQLGAVESLERLASIAIHGDDADRSAPLLGAAIALRKQLNTPLPSWRRSSQQEVEDVARHALGDARYEASVPEGTAMHCRAFFQPAPVFGNEAFEHLDCFRRSGSPSTCAPIRKPLQPLPLCIKSTCVQEVCAIVSL
jgi:hypothetical protein